MTNTARIRNGVRVQVAGLEFRILETKVYCQEDDSAVQVVATNYRGQKVEIKGVADLWQLRSFAEALLDGVRKLQVEEEKFR